MAHGSATRKLARALAGVLAAFVALVAAPAGAEERKVGGEVVPAAGVVDEKPEPVGPRPVSPIPPREPVPRIPEGGPLPFDFSGYFWVDTGALDRINNKSGVPDQFANYMMGRMVLAATFQRPLGDYFGRARVEFLGLVNESKRQLEPRTLDAYVMFGHEKWDVQVGRFLPWEIYYRGSGIDLYTAEEAGAKEAPPLYWLNYGRDYFNDAGQAAVHYYPFEWLGFELSGVYGQVVDEQNWTGLRPAMALKFGGFQALAGWEFLDQKPQTDDVKVEQSQQGWAARLQYDLPWLVVGVNYAQAELERTDIRGDVDTEFTADKWSAGAFADVFFLEDHAVGVGYHHTEQTNRQDETNYHDQAFVSYTYQLPFRGASVKAVYGYALGDFEDADLTEGNPYYTNDMRSFRLRVAYDFE